MLPLTLILVAAPVMPEAGFPKPVKGPLELGGVRPPPLESAKAQALAAQLLAWKSELQLPSTYQVQPQPTLDAWSTTLTPIARVAAGPCTEWVLEWNKGQMGSDYTGTLVVTTRADRVAIDAHEAVVTHVIQAANEKATTVIKADGTISKDDAVYLVGDETDVPEPARSGFELIGRDLRLKPDCTFETLPPVYRVLSGHVTDANTHEQMYLVDDGKQARVFYSSKRDSWVELTVEKPDRKLGTLSVLFPRSKARYPLKWNAERTTLTCLNPDGGTQLFGKH